MVAPVGRGVGRGAPATPPPGALGAVTGVAPDAGVDAGPVVGAPPGEPAGLVGAVVVAPVGRETVRVELVADPELGATPAPVPDGILPPEAGADDGVSGAVTRGCGAVGAAWPGAGRAKGEVGGVAPPGVLTRYLQQDPAHQSTPERARRTR